MLAAEHGHAAAKAINSMQPLLLNLQWELLQCAQAGSPKGAAACGSTSAEKLLSSTAVQQLLRWHACLESLDTNTLPPPCWHDVFAHLLLTGSLRAFGVGYRQVGFHDWPMHCSALHVAEWSVRAFCRLCECCSMTVSARSFAAMHDMACQLQRQWHPIC